MPHPYLEDLPAIMDRVFTAPPTDAMDLHMREAICRAAAEGCHETGDYETWLDFCAQTVKDWLIANERR